MKPFFELSTRWKDFVKSSNQMLVKKIVDDCLFHGIGTLIYYQPDGRMKDKRLLVTAGKLPGKHDATGWDWHQVGTFLAAKCQAAGIHLEVRKRGYNGKQKAA